MKTVCTPVLLIALALAVSAGCGEKSIDSAPPAESSSDLTTAGQSAVADDLSQKNVVQVAVGSADHSTLVTAVTTAGLVDVLSNVGPFTVFAPVNAAFDALPAGTVDNLLKPESKGALTNILEYHVYVGVIRESMIQDGMVLNQVNGQNVTLNKTGTDITINGAKVLGTVPASNGIVYVIDKVLLPPDKK
jgi:uncharacterized surface protein with fasciclin (FAS1) repeats